MSQFKKAVFILLTFLCAEIHVSATEYTVGEAINQYTTLKLSQPKPEEDGRIQTLNEKGAMSPVRDEATLKFIKNAHNKTVLEIGGAYGRVMGETLKQNSSVTYHLNDLDPRHLFIAAHNLEDLKLDKSVLEKVKFIHGNITDDLKFPETYDAILIARVLHFFSPDQLKASMTNIKNLLKPGGRVYVVAITPYVTRYQSFILEYEKRVKNKEAFPGYVSSLKDWVNEKATSSSQLSSISKDPFMFLDVPVLTRLFTQQGFKIIQCETADLGYFSSSWSLDGRENVILIAEKGAKEEG